MEQFAALNIELAPSDVDRWFQADGPGYEHVDEQEIVDLVSAEGEEDILYVMKKMQMKLQNTQRKEHNALFLMQKQCECLIIV